MPIHVIRDRDGIAALRRIIGAAATNGSRAVADLVQSAPPIDVLARMKFTVAERRGRGLRRRSSRE